MRPHLTHRRFGFEVLEDRRVMASDFIDPTFGREFTVDSSHELILGVAEQSDGGVIVIGRKGISRIELDGTQDMTFASDGLFEVDLQDSFHRQLDIDSHDRIIFTRPSSDRNGFEIVRLLENGELDISFGTDGVADHPVSGVWERTVAVFPDGGMIMVAREGSLPMFPQEGPVPTRVLHKISSSGQIDESFSIPEIDAENVAWGAATSNGELLLVYQSTFGETDSMLAKFTASGQLDASFGNAGTVLAIANGVANAKTFALDDMDRVVIAHQKNVSDEVQTVIQRFLPNGVPDSSFGNGGALEVDFAIASLYKEEYEPEYNISEPYQPRICAPYWRMIQIEIDSQNEVYLTALLPRHECLNQMSANSYAILSVGDDGNEELRGFFDDSVQVIWFKGNQFIISTVKALSHDWMNNEISILQLGEDFGRWHNSAEPLDVNEDGFVSAMDALDIINSLNLAGSIALLDAGTTISFKVDTNNDRYLSANDVLLVVNQLNRQSALADPILPSQQESNPFSNVEGEGELESDALGAIATMPIGEGLYYPMSPHFTTTDLILRPATKKPTTR